MSLNWDNPVGVRGCFYAKLFFYVPKVNFLGRVNCMYNTGMDSLEFFTNTQNWQQWQYWHETLSFVKTKIQQYNVALVSIESGTSAIQSWT